MVQAPYCVAPNLFEQLSAARLLGVAPGANDTLAFSLEGGSAIIYGATTDNTTQDPSLQIAKRSP